MTQGKLCKTARAVRDVLPRSTHSQSLSRAVHLQASHEHSMLRRGPAQQRHVSLSSAGPKSFSLHVTKIGTVPRYSRWPL